MNMWGSNGIVIYFYLMLNIGLKMTKMWAETCCHVS